MHRIGILFFIVTLPQMVFGGNPYTCSKAVEVNEFIYLKQDVSFPSCHASTIVQTKKGFLACWFGGTEERNPDVCIYASANINGRWSKPVKVADGVEQGRQYPCWNPVLFRRDNGDLILYYKVGPDPRSWWGLYKVSVDNGASWSAASKIPEKLLGPIKNKPVRLPDGNILYPTSVETADKWNIYMESSDQGLQWWKKTEIDNNGLNVIQPTVLVHKNGSLQLLCRSRNNHINTSWSKDAGKTWSPVTPTNLPNNNSGIDAVTLSNGSHALIYNPIVKGRNRLALAVSEDGINWNAGVLLEDDPDPSAEFSYPAIIQSGDGRLHVTYTWKRELMKHLVIDPAKLKTTPLVNGEWPEN